MPSAIVAGSGRVSVAAQGEGRRRTAKFLFDVATEGGAVGAHALRGEPVASGSAVVAAFLIVRTPPAGGTGATVALHIEGAGDLQTATAVTGAPWSTAGWKPLTLAVPLPLTTAARSVVATVGTAALTAGKFEVVLEYMDVPQEV